MGKVKRCKICLVQAEVDENGRCMSCANVYAASQAGVSYGQHMAQKKVDAPKEPVEVDVAPVAYKACGYCGELFDPGTSKRIYCSDDCYQKKCYERYRKRRAEGKLSSVGTRKVCPVCNAEFIQGPVGHGTAKYCSPACRKAADKQQREARGKRKKLAVT